MATAGVNVAVSFVGSISLVSVFVMASVTCGMTLVVDVIRDVVTIPKAYFWVLGLLVFICVCKLFVS